MVDPYRVPADFYDAHGTRDLRIDGALHMLVLSCKQHGTRCGRAESSAANRYSLNVVLRGRGRCEDARGNSYELSQGMIFQRHASLVRTTWFDPRSDYAECFVVLDGPTAMRLQGAGMLSTAPVVHIGALDAVVLDGFRHLAARARMPEAVAPSRRVLLEVVAWINDLYDRAQRSRVLGRWERAIEDACQLLEHNFDMRAPTESVAAQLGVSYAAFRKRFKAATGYSPADYRIRRRLESAQHSILGTSVSAAARGLGYSDVYTFSAQFRKFVGISPRAFRRRMRDRLVLIPLVRPRPPA